MWISIWHWTIFWKDHVFLTVLHWHLHCVISQVSIYMWICFWTLFYSIGLLIHVKVLHCPHYYSFTIKSSYPVEQILLPVVFFSRVPVLGTVNFCRNFRICFSCSQYNKQSLLGSRLRISHEAAVKLITRAIVSQDVTGVGKIHCELGIQAEIPSELGISISTWDSKLTYVAVGMSFSSLHVIIASPKSEQKRAMLCCLFWSVLWVTYCLSLLPCSVNYKWVTKPSQHSTGRDYTRMKIPGGWGSLGAIWGLAATSSMIIVTWIYQLY